jgi:GMP synthase (glutamine-hydrolysing)
MNLVSTPELPTIAILDAGGQYCHLIARKVRELGVYAEIKPIATPAAKLKNYKGIVISGGPSSVYAKNPPQTDNAIFGLHIPVLGICYGHQLMAEALGGKVTRGHRGEYGVSDFKISTNNSLFHKLSKDQRVWRQWLISISDGMASNSIRRLSIHDMGKRCFTILFRTFANAI